MDLKTYKKSQEIIHEIYYKASKTNDAYRIIDIINSLNDTQVEFKSWLAKSIHMFNPNLSTITVVAGWYGLTAYCLKQYYENIISIDIDKECELIGKRLFSGIDFRTEDLRDKNPDKLSDKFSFEEAVDEMWNHSDCIVNTSCEHFLEKELHEFIKMTNFKTWKVLTSTNQVHSSHINTHETVEDFVKQIRPSLVNDDVIFTDTLEQNDKLKFLVIAR